MMGHVAFNQSSDPNIDFRFIQWKKPSPFQSVVRQRADIQKQRYAEQNFPLDKSQNIDLDDMENTNYLKTQHFSRLSKTATYRAMKS